MIGQDGEAVEGEVSAQAGAELARAAERAVPIGGDRVVHEAAGIPVQDHSGGTGHGTQVDGGGLQHRRLGDDADGERLRIEAELDLRRERSQRDVLAPVAHFAVAAQAAQASVLQVRHRDQCVVGRVGTPQVDQHGVLGDVVDEQLEIGALLQPGLSQQRRSTQQNQRRRPRAHRVTCRRPRPACRAAPGTPGPCPSSRT